MARIAVVAPILLMVALGACTPVATPESAEQAILAQERHALDQWAQGNPLGFLDVDAPDVTYFDDIAATTRVDGIEAMRSYFTSLKGQIPPHTYQLLDPKVQLYGDVGILTLRFQATTADGKLQAPWKATSVYHRGKDGWRIVHAHWSTVEGS